MNETINLFDMVPEADTGYKKPIKSTDWKWTFKDYPPKNGLKVFSCFACGGGSTMGYKLAGCEVLGCVEIAMDRINFKNQRIGRLERQLNAARRKLFELAGKRECNDGKA